MKPAGAVVLAPAAIRPRAVSPRRADASFGHRQAIVSLHLRRPMSDVRLRSAPLLEGIS